MDYLRINLGEELGLKLVSAAALESKMRFWQHTQRWSVGYGANGWPQPLVLAATRSTVRVWGGGFPLRVPARKGLLDVT